MASTLTAVDIAGIYDGFFDGLAGSLSPELLSGETDSLLVTGLTANRITWSVVGDQVAALSGLTHLKVDGVDYPVTSGPTFSSPNTDTEFGPISDLTPGTYTVELVGVGGDTTPPTITSSSTIAISERTKLAHALTANEAVTWSLVGGADQADFELSGSTLRWAGDTIRFYNAPADADTNNTYIVTVRATDGASNTTDQTITATVSAGAVSVKVGFGQTENNLSGGSAAWDTANAGPILLADYFAAAPTSVTGTLAATEAGSDTAAIAGKVAVQGTLAATESGADVAAFTGNALAAITGSLSATESGADTATIAGKVAIQGSLSATESGSDTASFSGVVRVSGALACVEAGADTASASGTVRVSGSLAATESGTDTAAITGTVSVAGITGTLAASETGADTAAISGKVLVSGTLAASESGADVAAITGAVLVSGTLAAAEAGSDTASIAGTVPITGTMGATESGADTIYLTSHRLVTNWTDYAIPAPVTGWVDYERPRPVGEWVDGAIPAPVIAWTNQERPRPVTGWTASPIAPPVSGWVHYKLAA